MRAVWEERLSLICYKNSVGRTSVIERTSVVNVARIVWEEIQLLKCIDNESSVGRTSVINMLQE